MSTQRARPGLEASVYLAVTELSFLISLFLSTSLLASKRILKSKSFANGTIDQTLQASVTRLTNHVKILEEKIQQKRK